MLDSSSSPSRASLRDQPLALPASDQQEETEQSDSRIEQRRQDIVSAVTKVNSGAGVVVLTDMFGGTPSNLAISIMNGSNIEVIAAVNLPMLIKLAAVRETSSLEQAVIQAQDAGRRYIYAASRVLGAKPDQVDMPFDQVA